MFIKLTLLNDEGKTLVNVKEIFSVIDSESSSNEKCTDIKMKSGFTVEVKETIEQIEAMLNQIKEVPG